MGQYRDKYRKKHTTRSSLPRGVKWAQEGEFCVSLGVPIGNDLDGDKWWENKLEAVRTKAKQWAPLYRCGYYGRNLITQAMYFAAMNSL